VMARSQDTVRKFYDTQGGASGHDYHADSIRGEVNGHIHRRFLDGYIKPGDRVLEVGAGVGKFTVDLIRRGATVEVTDISQTQLDANERYVAEEGCEHGVIHREQRSITDLGGYESSSFDRVLAYGGPLSYAFEGDFEAMRNMIRIIKPNGHAIGSVMSRIGMMRWYYENRPQVFTQSDPSDTERFFVSGDWRFVRENGHICQLYTWQGLVNMIETAGGFVLQGSSSNALSMISEEKLTELKANREIWSDFLRREVLEARRVGARDIGTHILYAAKHGHIDNKITT
jgi:ubiquinone/menaquinone biosynthesis C-methylase UbiE